MPGKPRHTLKNNFKILREGIGWDSADLIHLATCRSQWRTLGEHDKEFSGSIMLEMY
jgi:hypothetical protein